MNWLAEALHGHFVLEAIGPMGCMHAKDSGEQHVADFVIDQLRTDEAVERVARALVGVAFCAEEPDELEKLKDSRWDAFEEDARAAITALLGEEP